MTILSESEDFRPDHDVLGRFRAGYTVDAESGCWLWRRSLDSCGYGRLRVGGRLTQAHRASLLLAGVELQPGQEVTQRCGNRACVNRDHLQVTSRASNPTRGAATTRRWRNV